MVNLTDIEVTNHCCHVPPEDDGLHKYIFALCRQFDTCLHIPVESEALVEDPEKERCAKCQEILEKWWVDLPDLINK